MAIITAHVAAVQELYVAYFNRPADTAGLEYWTNVVEAQKGATTAVSAAFAAEAEYKSEYPATMSNADIVNKVYLNLFGRPAEDAGKAYWADLLDKKAITIDKVVAQIADGARGTDAEAYENKVLAATAFTNALDQAYEANGYRGAAANTAAKAFISGITTDASLEAAIAPATLSASVAKVVAAGTPFSLTYGLEARDAAIKAKADFLAAADGDNDPKTSAKEADITSKVTTTTTAVDNLVAGDYAGATPAVQAALLQAQIAVNNATLADAQAGETAANAAIAKVAGLSAAIATLDAAKAGLKAATTTETNASAKLAAEVASYNVLNTTKIGGVAADGTVAGLIEINADTKALQLVEGVTEAKNPGITAVLNASIALEAANKAVATATTTQTNAQKAVDTLDLTAAAKLALVKVADAMTVVDIADGATPTAAQITTEQATLDARAKTATDIAAQAGSTQAQKDAAAAATKAANDFKALVDAFNAADDANPLVSALTNAKATVTTANNTIKSLNDAVTAMNKAKVLETQLKAVNASIDAANDAFLDNDLSLPVTATGSVLAGAGSDIFVAGTTGGTITNFGLLGDDSLFIGSKYTLNTTAKYDAAKGTITGGNNAALEAFIFQKGDDTVVILEKSVFGSSAATPEVITITLTGVEATDVTLSNGIVTV